MEEYMRRKLLRASLTDMYTRDNWFAGCGRTKVSFWYTVNQILRALQRLVDTGELAAADFEPTATVLVQNILKGRK